MSSMHLHMISDSTGETVGSAVRAALAQIEGALIIPHLWPLVRTSGQLGPVFKALQDMPGLVVSTLVDPTLQKMLADFCAVQQLFLVPLLEPLLSALQAQTGITLQYQPGRQHVLDEAYFRRIAALDFALAHDDGRNPEGFAQAEILLLGVSRTSKTPTSLYLANKGYRVANVPLVLGMELVVPEGPLVVGLYHQAERLSELRQGRMAGHSDAVAEAYYDPVEVQRELVAARRLFQSRGWPVIDVTRRAIEETAAEIMVLYSRWMEHKHE